jgi:hypothetical protein
LAENRKRGKDQSEYELLETGVFNENRYFDVFVEYAKANVEDIFIRITIENRGPKTARLRLFSALYPDESPRPRSA